MHHSRGSLVTELWGTGGLAWLLVIAAYLVAGILAFRTADVRPSEDAAALAHRMGHRQVTRVVVTRSDGTLVGLFFAADLPS